MAARFWVGGTGNWDAATTTNWSATSGGAGGASVPTSADTVTFDTNSGASATVTVTAPANASTVTINKSDITVNLSSSLTVAGLFQLTTGTFNAGTQNVTCDRFNSSNSNVRSLTLGTGTWSLTGTAAQNAWNTQVITNLTFSGASATIVISSASANTRTFLGNGLTYGTLTYTVAGSTGQLNFTDSSTFTTINFSDVTNARTMQFAAGTTTTVTNFNVSGTAGKLMSIVSSSAGTPATLSKATGVIDRDYLSIKDSTATGGATWYAGANSTNVSGNTGWMFASQPATVISRDGTTSRIGFLRLNSLARL